MRLSYPVFVYNSCSTYCSHIHPLHLHTPTYPTLSFFLLHQIQFVLPGCYWECGPAQECGQYAKGHTTNESWFAPCQELWYVNSPSASGGTSCQPSLLHAEMCLSWTCAALMYAFTATENSCVHPLCCIWKLCFLEVIHYL